MVNSKEHIKHLVQFLIDEVISAGGDGDSFWYSRYFKVDDIYDIIEECFFDQLEKMDWHLSKSGETIKIEGGEESLIITNDLSLYETCPDWVQCIIRW